MDTPERSKIGTPVSKFEDSPVFNFINSLSPIQPVKSAHAVQTFQSLSLASISSIFTSPHVNLQRESRFLIRNPCSDLSKQEISCDNGNENSPSSGCPSAVKVSTCMVIAKENCNLTCTLNEATIDLPDESSNLPSDYPPSVQYDCGSPSHNASPCYIVKHEVQLDTIHKPEELVQYTQDGPNKRKSLFCADIVPQEKHQPQRNEEGVSGCDWENLICDVGDNLLIFNSSESESCKVQDESLGDNVADSYNSFSSKLHQDVMSVAEKTQPNVSFGCGLQGIPQDPSVSYGGVREQTETENTPQILSGLCQNLVTVSGANQKMGDGCSTCISIDCKGDPQQLRGMRRRCLVFDLGGVSRKNLHNDSNIHPSTSSLSHEKIVSEGEQLVSLKSRGSSSPYVLPGIGLHLNTLAANSKDRLDNQEILASGRQLMSVSCNVGLFPSKTAGVEALLMSTAVKKDLSLPESDSLDLQVLHDDVCRATGLDNGKELTSRSSPKKKRRKSENGGESDRCRRCHCKKSKCLKLYCECFAAGVYCVEPCTCQGCLNKPIHEETVLATRKQIESRNPLAFAPKVIRTSESSQDMGEEANKTPASARHKRGCNCKKSSCLKKYCECYQGGVGCSVSCRCEGCKNVYGQKEGGVPAGAEEIDIEEEEADVCEKESEKVDEVHQSDSVRKDEHEFSETPLQLTRPLINLPLFSSGKPPRSSILPIGHSSPMNAFRPLKKCEIPLSQRKIGKTVLTVSEDDTPEILRGNASPINCVKTSSPNRKRISPPHHGVGLSPSRKGCRKLILKSIPAFPSLNADINDECQSTHSNYSANSY